MLYLFIDLLSFEVLPELQFTLESQVTIHSLKIKAICFQYHGSLPPSSSSPSSFFSRAVCYPIQVMWWTHSFLGLTCLLRQKGGSAKLGGAGGGGTVLCFVNVR
jgi:hypothetical protein